MIVIHGGHFSSLKVSTKKFPSLMKDTDWKVGTLDGFDDILYGGFGVFENQEELKIWKESQKSKRRFRAHRHPRILRK
jgi:hypothetical protein